MVIDGRKIAASIIADLKNTEAPTKHLAAVLVGNSPASASFVAQKEKVAKELGVNFHIVKLEAKCAELVLIAALEELGRDKNCGGVILQLPLPAYMDREHVIRSVPSGKDVDGLHNDRILPPAAGVVEKIIGELKLKTENLNVAIVGMGFLVGKPIAKWFEGKAKKLIALDISDDLTQIKNADVVILGAGKAGLVKPSQLKNDAVVIDFGYSRGADGVLHGDFDQNGAGDITYTPTPGGTGPILVAELFRNFYALNP
ncbi:MAG: bifunctional 5,10-methylenetetrahydrofolate dehydrogenase/5,10-methenyltetrahydrofolate cyclohydrolase [Candidatus Brennerbacteria bacterium]